MPVSVLFYGWVHFSDLEIILLFLKENYFVKEREKYGEEVAAYIQLKGLERASDTEIIDFCKDRISYHKIPKYIFFVDAYPTTASGKIQKYKLRELAKTTLSAN